MSTRIGLQAAGALCALTLAAAASAQDYPARDLELIVPYSAGGSVDAMARSFAQAFGTSVGRQVVVQNRDGAGGTIGVGAVAGARPDGYTILFSPSSPLTQAPYLMGRVPYDVADIVPVCQLFENPFVIAVRDDSPLKTLPDLLAAAKARPGAVSYGHAGLGSVPHLATANLARAAEVRFNDVAFRGDAQVLPQLLGGHVDFGAIGASVVATQPVRVLAALGEQPVQAFPDAPAVTEFGVSRAVVARNGLYVRRDVPAPVRQRLEQACETATRDAAFVEAAEKLHQRVRHLDGAAFAERLEADHKANRELIEALGLLGKS